MIRLFSWFNMLILLIISVSLSIGGFVFSQENSKRHVFHITKNPNFSHPLAVLKQLVIDKAHTKQNTFCVIGYQYDDGTEQAWVHWPEGKAIILWEPNLDGLTNLVHSKRYLRLPQDVIVDEKQMGGSTYLVTKQWVDSLIDDCHKQGEFFNVKR